MDGFAFAHFCIACVYKNDLFALQLQRAPDSMDVSLSFSRSPLREFRFPLSSYSLSSSQPSFYIRCNVPFPAQKAKFRRELEAAVDVVQRACHICSEVKRTLLLGSDGGILEKNDQTPVTVADFSVQALVSLELMKFCPHIPLVAEEDSAFLKSGIVKNKDGDDAYNFLVDSIIKAVTNNVSCGSERLSSDDVLQAIDRGGKDAYTFGSEPATYWVLDPIDGTRGFLRGTESLYVVGLSLIVEGDIVLGVMGCPNWKPDYTSDGKPDARGTVTQNGHGSLGIIMAAHVGCGTWVRRFTDFSQCIDPIGIHDCWVRCFVDKCAVAHEARFCIPDSQTWDSLPLSKTFGMTPDTDINGDKRQVVLLPTCCGSLCKYMMVASGRASAFILRTKAQTVIKVWDHAVGITCVYEAGGMVTDWRGNQIELASDQEGRRIIFPLGGVLVTNGSLHKQMVELLSTESSIV